MNVEFQIVFKRRKLLSTYWARIDSSNLWKEY